MDLSARIVAVRKSLGLSQEKFGEMVNMSQRSVAAWESGDRTPSFATLSALADQLGVTVDWLLGRTDVKTDINKKQPAVQDGELLDHIVMRLRDLPEPALSRVSDFLQGLQAGQEIAKEAQALQDPADEPAE